MRLLLRPKILYALPYDLRRGLYARLKKTKFERLQQKRERLQDDGYTYKPYDDYRCIFVHIPKAAGMSICRSLFGNLAGGHATLSDYQIIFPRLEFESYFKFTFVRNPWDRVFSAYNFLKKGGATEFDRQWAPHVRERRWHPTQRLEDLPGGGVELTMEVGGQLELQSWVLSFGSGAEVLEPPSLRDAVREALRETLAVYDAPKRKRPRARARGRSSEAPRR